uniref:SMP-LTD domain-containing protein n=1 Tax=Oryza nivara TaxID=4536 RepID=A0A0E0GF84_ORYNI
MALAFLLGFLLGLLALAALEAAALLWLVRRLRRRDSAPQPAPDADELPGERPFPYEKQGFLWILEPEKTPKASNERSSIGGPKETKEKKNIVEVFPAKRSAKIKGRSLILSGPDGFHTTIKLLNCTVFAVSASSMPSRKWAKRYPIKLESKEYQIYNGSKACYLYAETSWEKESWCKALRFLKPTVFSSEDHEVMDRAIKTDGSSKVRLFLKKLAKKASTKVPLEGKTSSGSSTQGERKILDKLRSYQGTPFIEGLMGSQDDKSNSSSSQDTVKPSPTSPALGQIGQPSAFPDVNADDRIADEGTLCWNLLSSRLFFDAKMSDEIHKAIKARIQRTLSSMRTPPYVGDITLADFSLGKLPPYVHAMRVLPLDLNELWAFEVDFEYSSGILLHIETRLEVQEPELQKDIMKSNFGTDSNGEVESDLLESIEQYGNQFRDSQNSVSSVEEKGEPDGSQPKSTGWTSAYISGWKNIMHSIADHVSQVYTSPFGLHASLSYVLHVSEHISDLLAQVPLSLAIKISSVRGVLRVHVKPPPSDQLWYGFTSMPDLEWDIESSIGDRKITNSHIGSLIGNRFKASLRDSLVLPNCESISIPFMLAEKDDWVPLKDAPFIWLNREPTETRSHAAAVTPTRPDEVILKDDASNKTVAPSLPNSSARSEETLKTAASIDEPTQVPVAAADASHEPRKSPLAPAGEASSPSSPDTIDELRKPLLITEKIQEEDSESKVESPSPLYTSLRGIVPAGEQSGDESKRKGGRRARMMDFGKKMGDKLEEKRRHIEEKGRNIVEKMRENARTNSFDRSMTSSSHSNSQSQ